MLNYIKSQTGVVTLVATMIIASGVLAIVLSTTIIALNDRVSLSSFGDSVQSFYSAESGVSESLMQLRKNPSNLIFDDITVAGLNVSSEFVEEETSACEQPSECQFVPDSGWGGEYFNHSVNHPDMEVNPYPGPTPTPTEHDWYDDQYKTHEQIDASIVFATSMWFPYDGTEWEDKEGFDHDYHFTQHWRARVTASVDGDYGYNLASDDDSWVVVNGVVVVNNSGTHAAFTKTGDIFLAEGNNTVEVYFAERHVVESGFRFSFDDPALVITPYPEGCEEDLECNSNIEAAASTTQATRKVRYTCNNNIANCFWRELTP